MYSTLFNIFHIGSNYFASLTKCAFTGLIMGIKKPPEYAGRLTKNCNGFLPRPSSPFHCLLFTKNILAVSVAPGGGFFICLTDTIRKHALIGLIRMVWSYANFKKPFARCLPFGKTTTSEFNSNCLTWNGNETPSKYTRLMTSDICLYFSSIFIAQ